MNAPAIIKSPGQRIAEIVDALPDTDVEAVIVATIDMRSRARIANAWIGGWITGDDAMRMLVDFDLIEHDAELVAEARGQ